MKRLILIVIAALFGWVVGALADDGPQQFVFQAGSAQVGSRPGRVDLKHPVRRVVEAGDRIELTMTLGVPDDHPCSKGRACLVTIGLASSWESSHLLTKPMSSYWVEPPPAGNLTLRDLVAWMPRTGLQAGNADIVVWVHSKMGVHLFEYTLPVLVQ